MKNRLVAWVQVHRLWQRLALLVILGLAVHLILPQIASLENSWRILKALVPWAIGAAIAAQVMSYVSAGYVLRALLSLTQRYVALGRSIFIVMGSASIGTVAGGIVGTSAAVYRWTSKEGGHSATAILPMLLPSLLNTLVVVAVSLFGVVHLVVVHNLSMPELAGFCCIILLLTLAVGVAAMALCYRDQAIAAAIRVARRVARLQRKSFDPSATRQWADNLFGAWDALLSGGWWRPTIGGVVSVAFDMLTLFFLFVASGRDISPGVLLAGYGLPLLLGKIAFMFPGGVGIIEGSMVALYAGLGVPKEVAVVVVLGYRLISFWLPTLSGYPIAAYLERSRGAGSESQSR